MAKAKYNSSHHLQKFFIIFGALFSIAALGIIVFASQQKTNTQSDASGDSSCIAMNPKISLTNTAGAANSVTYTIRIKNMTSKNCAKIIRSSPVSDPFVDLSYVSPSTKHDGWTYRWNNPSNNDLVYLYTWGYLDPEDSRLSKLKITPGPTIKKGTYYLPVRICRTDLPYQGGDSAEGYSLQDYIESVTSYCDKLNIKYVKS
jgi:hypothetical protein